MSDIFYTAVDRNLQLELLARGAAGKRNRTTKDLDFMLGKVANVQITPYEITYKPVDKKDNEQVVDQKLILYDAILGGNITRGGEFMPNGPRGFLSDRPYYSFIPSGPIAKIIQNQEITDGSNTSRRIPPYITAVSIQIGDDSMGVMQTATVNVTVPNPVRDLNFFESVYLKPGRHVRIELVHPESAIITKQETGGKLSNEVMPSVEKLKSLGYSDEDREEFSKMNKFIFDGVITSFDLNYQEDASVAVGLSIRGTTQIYTDVSMAMNEAQEKETKTATQQPTTFWKRVLDVVEQKKIDLLDTPGNDIAEGIYEDRENENIWYMWGKVYSDECITYITLGALIDFINRFIISKLEAVIGKAEIICDKREDLCTSKYYERMVSCNVQNIIFPKQDNYAGRVLFRNLDDKKPSFVNKNNQDPVSYPSLIFISMPLIQQLHDEVMNVKDEKNPRPFNVKSFLIKLSAEIYNASGRAFDMQLISHPDLKTKLLYYDANQVRPRTDVPQPFNIPMFANDEIGTIVRSFNFNGKLPQDASTLAYVMNQDPSNMDESDIAPFLSYMYSANTFTRGVSEDGLHYEVSSNIITEDILTKINEQYTKQHEERINALTGSIEEYSKNFESSTDAGVLLGKMKKYVQYPMPTIQETNQMKAPVIPFDASFDIDGINGFRYGDVLTFKGLPARYTNNTVFSIVGINHDVNESGEWTTGIKCIMRPRIDFKE
jgi:hypothetical protein